MSPTRKTLYDVPEIKAFLRQYISDNFDYTADAARHFDVSPQYLDMVTKDKHKELPNKNMLETIGFQRETQLFSKLR